MAYEYMDGMFEKPRVESTCRLILESDKPCQYSKIAFLMCHAWYKVHQTPLPFSMREIFVKGLREAREEWDAKCGERR